jgi:hypothetical protein
MHALGNRILGAAATKKLQLPAKSEILMAQQNDNVLMQVRGWVRTLKPQTQPRIAYRFHTEYAFPQTFRQ